MTDTTAVPPDGTTCAWFARCGRPAAAFEPHPILKLVPVCLRCAARLRRMEEQ